MLYLYILQSYFLSGYCYPAKLAHNDTGGTYEHLKEAFEYVYQFTFPEQTDVADRYLQLSEQ